MITQLDDPDLIAGLRAGSVAVLKTDTLYGIVALATNETAVQKVYDLKHRDPAKACIVLLADQSQILPDTQWTEQYQQLARKYWPGPVTIIAPVTEAVPAYIRRQQTSVAYRLPDRDDLRALLRLTGPLIAPSANPEGQTPATTTMEAVHYFGDQVDYYVDGGPCDSRAASRIVRLTDAGQEEILR